MKTHFKKKRNEIVAKYFNLKTEQVHYSIVALIML